MNEGEVLSIVRFDILQDKLILQYPSSLSPLRAHLVKLPAALKTLDSLSRRVNLQQPADAHKLYIPSY